jgi:hypothetical protein
MAGLAGAVALMLAGVGFLAAADRLARYATAVNAKSAPTPEPPVVRWYQSALGGSLAFGAFSLAIGVRWALSITVRAGLTQAFVALGVGAVAVAADAIVTWLAPGPSRSVAGGGSARRRILTLGGGTVAVFGLLHLVAILVG